jgi:integrase/recombinase XerD
MYSINFRIRTEKLQSDKRKIYVRLKINGVCCSDFATSINIYPNQWIKETQTIKGNSPLDYTNRAMLLQVESDLTELIRANPNHSAIQIRALYIGGAVAPALMLKSYLKFIQDKKEVFNGTPLELAKNTLQRWYNCQTHLSEFLKGKDMELNSIRADFAENLYLYLIKKTQKSNSKKKIGHDFAVRNLTYLSEVLDYCKVKKWIETNPLNFEYVRNPPKEIEYLTHLQLQQIERLKFSGTLENIRVVFLAMSYSGLNHCDLNNLETLKGNDNLILKIDRQKNDKREQDKAIIPIFPELRKLLETYDYQLPLHDLNTTNRHLHIFEGLLGVSIKITTYTARKTAAMLLSERGVSIDVVSKILGHKSILTTQRHYVKVAEKRVLEETKHLFNQTTT